MLTYDDKITFINNLDQKVFESKTPAKKTSSAQAKKPSPEGQEEEQTQLPIVLHEREIMENIENFMVTIVCGETGSGKST